MIGSLSASLVMGERCPSAVWSHTGLYQPSMGLKQANFASAWKANLRVSSSSQSSVAKKSSVTCPLEVVRRR